MEEHISKEIMEEPEERSQQSVNLVVGGIYYSLSIADISRFPDSYFAHLTQSHWTKDTTVPVRIDRSGALFRHIYFYVHYEILDLPSKPITDFGLLLSVRAEADFYNLPDLVKTCDLRVNVALKSWCQKQLPYQNTYGLYDCVQEGREKSSDALLNAVHLFRPPCVATVTGPEIGDVSYDYLFENSRTKAERMVRGEDEHCASAAIDKPRVLRQAFSVCPLTGFDLQPYPAPTHIDNFVDIYAYRTGEACSKRPQYYWSGLKVGTILCILKSEHTGGKITAQVNGQTFSIEEPGECLALQLGISYAVEEVTSGLLEVVEYAMYHYEWREKKEPVLPWVSNVSTTQTHDMICCGILTALGSEFERYKGVVLCLTDFYPIVPSCSETRRFETTEQALTELERQLLSRLAQHYNVEIVTVSVSFSSEYTVIGACVLDYLPTIGHYESIQNITATVAKDEEISPSAEYKVMVPRYGYGEKFSYEWDCPWYNYKGTLLSGFMITEKEIK